YEALHHHIRPLLIIAVIPGALSAAAVGIVRDAPMPIKKDDATAKPVAPVLPAQTKRVILFLGVFSIVNFPDALLILRAKALGLSFGAVILAYCVYNISSAGLSYPLGALSDHWAP